MAPYGPGAPIPWGNSAIGEPEGRVLVPTLVATLSDVSQISAWGTTGGALTDSGDVYTWGRNSHHQLGHSPLSDWVANPTLVPGLGGVVDIATGFEHTAALLANGTVMSWGSNSARAIGDGIAPESVYRPTPAPVVPPGDAGIVAVEGGQDHVLAITESGGVLTWGSADLNPDRVPPSGAGSGLPTAVPGLGGPAVDIAAGYRTSARGARRRIGAGVGRQLLRDARRRHLRRPANTRRGARTSSGRGSRLVQPGRWFGSR